MKYYFLLIVIGVEGCGQARLRHAQKQYYLYIDSANDIHDSLVCARKCNNQKLADKYWKMWRRYSDTIDKYVDIVYPPKNDTCDCKTINQ